MKPPRSQRAPRNIFLCILRGLRGFFFYVITMHLAQVNISRVRAPLDHPSMHGFVSRLAEFERLGLW
jgi:hypothetical protein